ncbi:hypothetical protein GUJ93_ZPchr0004g39210 [Zizania palustris]|uniref:Uncharacterized protein n=1 Tax=Zizania palustris TaxID=103762 RepID=A0A8J5T001_ZIZPA|nr:hypothetical protein GUJ93_ZPchr0004g39210 [Zizania palustris]
MGSAIVDLGSGSGLKAGARRSNLRSFLHIATPSLDAYTVAKGSACGVYTPIRLPSGETIEQYFVPHLSAIQLYTIDDSALTKGSIAGCHVLYALSNAPSISSIYSGSTPPDSKVALTLAPFGLATHKTDEDVWTSKDSGDQELVTSLVGATDSWLKKLGIKHHDFSYFLNNNKDIIHYRSITKASTSASTGTDTATA